MDQVLVGKPQCRRLAGNDFSLICLSSRSPAEALAKMKDRNMSASFQDLFLPNGQPPLPGLFAKRLDLAAILDAVAVKGISEFYSGNLTQEMAAAVRWCFPFLHCSICMNCFTKTFFFVLFLYFILCFCFIRWEQAMASSQRRTLETTPQFCSNQLRSTIKVLKIV